MKVVYCALLAAAVGACSMTLPVQGSIEDGSETFTGSATGYIDGGGTLTLTSNKGLSCSGIRLRHEARRQGDVQLQQRSEQAI
jgi:hypothetical protein